MTDRIKQVKVALVAIAVLIAAASLLVSHALIRDLSRQERNNMEVWAEAMRSLSRADENTDLNLVLKVINGNNYIPVVVLDARDSVLEWRNIDIEAATAADSLACVAQVARQMSAHGNSISVQVDNSDLTLDNGDNTAGQAGASSRLQIVYDESEILRRLASYPYVQLGVISLFVVVAVFALLASKRAEQNKVWVGLSRETAHQLGTPISSLMAWSEVLRETYPEDPLLPEMDKDICRLQLIAERFSKIGSRPEFASEDLTALIGRVVDYIGRRTSDKVQLTSSFPGGDIRVDVCAPLFEWVIENLCKNAIDAMQGQGKINIYVYRSASQINIEVSDTGKGIPKKDFRNVFRPGFTTKKRGWGLGLSLAKRIVEEYHHGRIYVKQSQEGSGTTFAIELPL